MPNLLETERHFAFGENWKSFLKLVDQARVSRAEEGLRRLFPGGELQGASMIDIGCGSGLSALAAIKLGASHVECLDIDLASVEATSALLSKLALADQWNARVASVFDLEEGQYDIVYSWGVLHHTGDMWRAVEQVAGLVKPAGTLCIALYGKGRLCGFWRWEKRLYTRSPVVIQWFIRTAYKAIWFAYFIARGRNPWSYIHNYRERGMDWGHDVHDWLGGYPYQSATPKEVEGELMRLGFRLVRSFTYKPNLKSGCDEYVATKV